MKNLLFTTLLTIVITHLTIAQVGIGTTTPNALMDIRSSNQATPASNDGLLIPKIDEFPVTNPAAGQDGMMVYVTGNGSPAKGFYYWDQTATSWQNVLGVKKINELQDGISDNDGSEDGSSLFLGIDAGISDDLTDNRNIGIGFQSLQNNAVGMGNIGIGYTSLQNNTGYWNIGIGPYALNANQGGDFNTAVGNSALNLNESGRANTALGTNALQNNVAGEFNVAVGNAALFQNLENNLTAVGSWALFNNTTGTENTAVGYDALNANQTGSLNTAMGFQALKVNTATQNTAFGARVLENNTTGYANTAIGSQSMSSNIGGSANTVIGAAAFAINTSGSSNTAVGVNTMFNNTTGSRNVASGFGSMQSNTIGSYNVAQGFYSLYTNTTGNYNTALGYYAMYQNDTGIENVALGSGSLYENVSGNYNVALGNNALRLNTTGNNNTSFGTGAGYSSLGTGNVFLGYNAGYNETGSNRLYIDNSNANASNALIYGEFDTNLLRINGHTEITVTTDATGAVGTGALEIAGSLRLDGNEIITNTNNALFMQADNNGDLDVDSGTLRVDASANRVGVATTTPDYTFSVSGVANINENIASGVALRVNGSEALWYNGTYFSWGFGGSANYFADNIGIGETAPNVALDVIGSIEYTGTITDVSDRRLKENFEPIANAVSRLQKVSGYTYNMIGDEDKTIEYGVIAQELQKVFPEMVTEVDPENGYLGVSYIQLIPVLLEAIKEQQQNLEELRNELATKSQTTAKLEERLAKIEAILLK